MCRLKFETWPIFGGINTFSFNRAPSPKTKENKAHKQKTNKQKCGTLWLRTQTPFAESISRIFSLKLWYQESNYPVVTFHTLLLGLALLGLEDSWECLCPSQFTPLARASDYVLCLMSQADWGQDLGSGLCPRRQTLLLFLFSWERCFWSQGCLETTAPFFESAPGSPCSCLPAYSLGTTFSDGAYWEISLRWGLGPTASRVSSYVYPASETSAIHLP